MGTSKILYKFGLTRIWAIPIRSTLPQSSAIRLQRGNLPKFGSAGADAYETTGRTQVNILVDKYNLGLDDNFLPFESHGGFDGLVSHSFLSGGAGPGKERV